MGELNERIKQLRRERKLSQEELAKYIGVTRTAIVEIEAANRKVSAEELRKFSELFRVSADELLFGKKLSYDLLLLQSFSTLDESDQKEILGLIEFKRMRKEQGLYGHKESRANKKTV